jgi:lambda repressor-like predicted transcriptional regulator
METYQSRFQQALTENNISKTALQQCMRFGLHKTYREIADITGSDPKTIWGRCNKADQGANVTPWNKRKPAQKVLAATILHDIESDMYYEMVEKANEA